MLKVTLLDGYIDDPTCLGVPPYISPYPRYISGAIWEFDKKANISYFTIDQLRNNEKIIDIFSKSNIVIVISGMSVPGRYLSGYPISPNEIISIMNKLYTPFKILCGPAGRHGFGLAGGKKTRETDFVKDYFDLIVKGDSEIVISNLLKYNLNIDEITASECRKNAHEISSFSQIGSNIVNQHPFFPDYLICEIETYRGCPRSIVGGCSFCSEPLKGLPDFRPVKDVIDEIKCLYKNGIRHFRIGSQPCIFSYMSEDAGKKEFPKPNPNAIEDLFNGIRKVAKDLKTLHVDNANPGVIARYPIESKKIAKIIVKYHTPGDVAAMGVESVDPIVAKKNNLKASADEVMQAIKIINEVGSTRGNNGMPEFLPGLNFVFGLIGETKKTFELDYNFLKQILDENLLIRRINLRQIIPIPNTKMFEMGSKNVSKHKADFKRFKRKVQKDIERPMLEKLLPRDTIVKEVYTEMLDGKTMFARQIGSYPLLVGIPGFYKLNKFVDVCIVDYGYRSITGVIYPMNPNKVSREMLEIVPGIGKKRAIRILANRPFKDKSDFINCFDDKDVAEKILKYFKIK